MAARRLRWLHAVDAEGVPLQVGPGAPVPLAGRIAQVGRFQWGTRGLPAVPVEVHLPAGWVRGTVPLGQVEVPVPRGTSLYARPDGDPVGISTGPLFVRPRLRRGAWILTRVRIHVGCGGSLRLWVRQTALQAAAAPRPVPGAWTRPVGSGLRVSCVSGALELCDRPGGRPLLVLPLCSVLSYELHRLERRRVKRKRWWRLRYRPDHRSPLLLRGWMLRRVVRQAVHQTCSCQCVRHTAGIPTHRPRRVARLLRAVPLYRRPDARAGAVGRLERGFRLERPERLPASGSTGSGWMRVYLRGQAFYAPYRAGGYVVDQGR